MKSRLSFLLAIPLASVAAYILGGLPVADFGAAEAPASISTPPPAPDPAPKVKKRQPSADEPAKQARRIGDFIAKHEESPQEMLLAAIGDDEEARQQIVREWSQSEPQRAAIWAGALPRGEARTAMLTAVQQPPSIGTTPEPPKNPGVVKNPRGGLGTKATKSGINARPKPEP